MMPAPHKWRSRTQVNTASNACLQICIYTAYCIWRVISPISELNRLFSSLRLFYHVPLKRDQMDWDRRTRLDDTPNVIGCIYKWVTNEYGKSRMEESGGGVTNEYGKSRMKKSWFRYESCLIKWVMSHTHESCHIHKWTSRDSSIFNCRPYISV